MIRRRQHPSLTSGDGDNNGDDNDDDKKSIHRQHWHSYSLLPSLLFRFGKLWTTVAVVALVLLVTEIASYVDDSAASKNLLDPHRYDPNNDVDGNDDDVQIPYIKHEPMAFKNIKARFDHATSIGQSGNPNNTNNTSGQYLLDFGIIGFPKCGTTTMMKWLNLHPSIAVLDFEITALQKHHPARLLNYIIKDLPEGRYRRGYKSPTDVEHGRARNKLGVHYGKTRLLVGLRHPVLWYESFYNHRIQNGYNMPDLEKVINDSKGSPEKIESLQNNCDKGWKGVCFHRGSFHFVLAKWGKTPLLFDTDTDKPNGGTSTSTDTGANQQQQQGADKQRFNYTNYNRQDEFSHFTKKDKELLIHDAKLLSIITPNPIFLYDVNQLRMPRSGADGADNSDSDNDNDNEATNDYRNFVLSLQAFLGVPQNASAMPPMIRESPGKTDLDATEQQRRNALKIDLCDDRHEIPRKWLMEIGSNAQLWIQNYFVKSPHNVFVGGDVGGAGNNTRTTSSSSSGTSSQFLAILESYGKDPCPERRRKQAALKSSTGKN